MRKLWACALVLGTVGLTGCSGTVENGSASGPAPTPSPVNLAISGGVSTLLSIDGKTGPEAQQPCKPPAKSRLKLGMEIRVTDDSGKLLGSQKLDEAITLGTILKECRLDFSFKVPGDAENYKLTIGDFQAMSYTREDIRRGLSFYETEQGTLAPR
ncbi:hypothetical protein ACIRQY_35375 [Streptomyces sp. NPDC101490]|uniref:hypothetical protein n=1 Tax=Streptomyces sp. NPDC101490 TaxID=3366143 RepID=UPI0038148F3F